MKQSMIKWHLARDNQSKLAKFCEKNGVKTATQLFDETFNITYMLDNGGYITAELLRGTADRSFSVADHFQVVDYDLGN